MSTDSDQPTRADLVARAWELSTGNAPECADGKPLSTRAVGRTLGVSQSTASRLIRDARYGEAWVDLHDQREARQALAVGHMEVLGRLERAMNEDPDRLKDYAPIWFRGAGQLAQLLGANAPVRVQTEDVTERDGPRPDPEIRAAVQRAQAAAAQRRAEIRGHSEPADENGDEE